MADTNANKQIQKLVGGVNGVLLSQEADLLENLTRLRGILISLVSEISNGVFSRGQLNYIKAVVGVVKTVVGKIYDTYRGASGMKGKIANMAKNVLNAADNVLNEIERQLEKLPEGDGGADPADKIESELEKLIAQGKPLPFDPRQLD